VVLLCAQQVRWQHDAAEIEGWNAGAMDGGRRARSSSGGSASIAASAANTGTTGRLRRQRSREWRDRQYSTSEEESAAPPIINTSTNVPRAKTQRTSPTPAVYSTATNSVYAGKSPIYSLNSTP